MHLDLHLSPLRYVTDLAKRFTNARFGLKLIVSSHGLFNSNFAVSKFDHSIFAVSMEYGEIYGIT